MFNRYGVLCSTRHMRYDLFFTISRNEPKSADGSWFQICAERLHNRKFLFTRSLNYDIHPWHLIFITRCRPPHTEARRCNQRWRFAKELTWPDSNLGFWSSHPCHSPWPILERFRTAGLVGRFWSINLPSSSTISHIFGGRHREHLDLHQAVASVMVARYSRSH